MNRTSHPTDYRSAAMLTLRRPRLARSTAFAAIAATLVLFTAASSAPSPLYIVYQQEWGFSAITLTIVFAIYVLGLIGSLLVLGAISDHVGRRPVLAGAIAVEALALVLFIAAGDVTLLMLARLIQGIATGAALTTLAATLVDLNPPHAPGRAGLVNGVAPMSGLALGALGCGLLVQYGPAPTHLVYALLLAGMVVAGLAVTLIPETSARRPGGLASLIPQLGVPSHLRADLAAMIPILVASWALGGLYLSLGPSVAARLFGLSNHLIGGFVVTLLCGSGAVTAFLLRGWPFGRVFTVAASLLAAGMLLTLLAVQVGSVALAVPGTILSGVGFGAAALGCFGRLATLASPEERGELFAVSFVISYLAFSLPAVAAGFAISSIGLQTCTVIYSVAVALLALTALVLPVLNGGSARKRAA